MSYQQNFKTFEKSYSEKITSNKKEHNFYIVPMFPYPSGNIHMGHMRVYTISSVLKRYHEKKGDDVLHPIGFDSFGLPAETAAIKHGLNPHEWTINNIEKMKNDFHSMNFNFDWIHEIKTHEKEYYLIEQKIFKEAFKAGYIYKKEQYVNFDPVDKTVLSNEQVVNGKGWRSGVTVIRKKIPMYFFNVRKYAKELHNELTRLNWPKKVLEMQKNWINYQTGKTIHVQFDDKSFKVFDNQKESNNCILMGINQPFTETFIQREDFQQWLKETEVIGVSEKMNHHMNVYYNTGSMIDYEGKQYPILIDMKKDDEILMSKEKIDIIGENKGIILSVEEGEYIGLKDWSISRQRYWGNPIPMIECDDCGDVMSEDDVILPIDLNPDGEGNILDKTPSFYSCFCPQCEKPAKRCTDTMDTFVQSAWYYHRYINPQAKDIIPNADNQIDIYVGGSEHSTMHLIYTRFFHKMLRDLGMISTNEPIKKLITPGMVCKKYQKADGTMASAKMSKSLGNVVSPQDYIDKYGADAVQMFMIFAAPISDDFDFEDSGMVGVYRFLDEVYQYFENGSMAKKEINEQVCKELMNKMSQYIEKEFEGRCQLNTIIPQLMIAFKSMKKCDFQDMNLKEEVEKIFLNNLFIFAPNLTHYLKNKYNSTVEINMKNKI